MEISTTGSLTGDPRRMRTAGKLKRAPWLTPVFRLDIEIFYVERIFFDEFSARFNVFTHQRGENGLGFRKVLERYTQNREALGVHRSFPKRL